MADRIYSHEAMMREIAARAELRLAQHQYVAPRALETPFSSLEEFDDFIARRRQSGHADSRRWH